MTLLLLCIILGTELPDECSLRKCGVQNGDRLKLVLAMRGGPINTRRVAIPSQPTKPVGPADLQNLMLKNKEQILEKIPKNGQVTVLLFREGDKVNVYHVLEKPDGSFSPLSNADQSPLSSPEDHDEWSSSGPSIKRLLEHSDTEENPIIKQRLKENAVTMNKMSELRTQLENLSMVKRNKRRNIKKRPKSHRKSNNASRQSKWSASTSYSKNGTTNSTLPLPPINSSTNHQAKDVLQDKDEDFCTIQPLNRSKIRKEMSQSKVPDWLKKNEGHYHNHAKTFPIKHSSNKKESTMETTATAPNNIDLVDLQFRPDNALEMTNHRKAQKLISTDLSNVVIQDYQPKQGRLQRQQSNCSIKSKTRLNLSSSGRDSASPRTKAEMKQKWLKKPKIEGDRPDTTSSTMPLSESRDSLAFTSVTDTSDGLVNRKTNSPLLPLRSSSRASKGSGGKQNRPKFVANTLMTNMTKKIKQPNKSRCATCNKKINITNTFSCRCNKSFCPKHRHPELHSCTFDYRSEGRKQLEQANPVVMLPKLPKI